MDALEVYLENSKNQKIWKIKIAALRQENQDFPTIKRTGWTGLGSMDVARSHSQVAGSWRFYNHNIKNGCTTRRGIDFERLDDKTQLHWHMLFESRELIIAVVKRYKADEGLKQNIEKLSRYLQQISIL